MWQTNPNLEILLLAVTEETLHHTNSDIDDDYDDGEAEDR